MSNLSRSAFSDTSAPSLESPVIQYHIHSAVGIRVDENNKGPDRAISPNAARQSVLTGL